MVVVFLNYNCFEFFRLVNFVLFSCINKKIYTVPFDLVVNLIYLFAFVCIQQFCVRINGNNYTIF